MKGALFLIVLALLNAEIALSQIPKTMSYQGVLTDASGTAVPDGAYTMTFRLYEQATDGAALWQEQQSITVNKGIMNVILGSVAPLALPFDKPYWLGISIAGNPELAPRIALTASAYSMNARGVFGESNVFPSDDSVGIGTTKPKSKLHVAGSIRADEGIFVPGPPGPVGGMNIKIKTSSLWGQYIEATKVLNVFTGTGNASAGVVFYGGGLGYEYMRIGNNVGIGTGPNPSEKLQVVGTIHSTTGGFKFPDGTVQTTAATGTGGNSWSLTGNSGTVEGTHFLGTTDLVPFELRANNRRVLRLEAVPTGPEHVNFIGGAGNVVDSNVNSAAICGGYGNRISDNLGFVGGGTNNHVGDGDNNVGSAYATVGGGVKNVASAQSATAVGGENNTASGWGSTVGGGIQNTASDFAATVPGGFGNSATGYGSFAAGRQAKANHHGTFVWADYADEDFVSTLANQFLIRARNGVGIGTNNPTSALTVAGTIESTTGGFKFPDGTIQTSAATDGGGNSWSLTGNSGTTAGTHFLGTTDQQPLEIRVRGLRTLRLEVPQVSDVPNIIGGHSKNYVTDGVIGATISGGGAVVTPNRVTDNMGTVGGGVLNQAGNGDISATNAIAATVSGGESNLASKEYSTVGGGSGNSATGSRATVGGGTRNIASGQNATVPGGFSNIASGVASFAAGSAANAVHDGAFVWADATTAIPYQSTAPNQFLIRASGGVGIGTVSPSANLHVVGKMGDEGAILVSSTDYSNRSIKIRSYQSQGLFATNDLYLDYVGSIHFSENSVERMRIHAGGNVGIGTGSNPANILTVKQNSVTDPIADAWTTYSSRRWKTNIKTLERPLEKVQHLRGVSFDWIENGKHDLGLIAEEVGEVIPEVVAYEENGKDAKSVDYARLTALLIEAVKEQQATINRLSKRVEALESIAAGAK